MGRMTVTRQAWWKIAAVTLGTGLLAAACSSGGTPSGGASASGGSTSAAPSSPAPGPNAALCQDLTALHASLDKLSHISVGSGAADQLKSDLADVKAKLAALTAQAHGQWQSQISDLKAALAKLQTAAANLAAHPSTSTAASNLLAAMSTDCPSASP